MKRFADTYFFLALINSSDSKHALAKRYSEDQSIILVTTEWVLLEAADGLAARHLRRTFLNLAKRLYNFPKSQVLEANHATFEAALQLYTNRPDKDWSLTDGTSFVIMKQNKLNEALTADHHFEQAGFVALLK